MQGQSLLPPIFQPGKAKKKKAISNIPPIGSNPPPINNHFFPTSNRVGNHSPIMNITMNNVTVNHFNSTKKQFPQIKKISDHHHKKYVSPYSLKSMNK
jgi:hypothetical protein